MLMSDVFTFCEKTKETVSLEIKETPKELNNKLENEEREEINAALRKNNEINRKYLLQRKNKKFTNLKYKPTRPTTEKQNLNRDCNFTEKQIILVENQPMQTSSVNKLILTSRKLSKQNIVETNNNS